MTQDLKQHVERLVEYSNSIRDQSEVIDYVLARIELLNSSKYGSATVLVLANPLAGEDGGVDSEVVLAWMPHFQDYVAHRIRNGYLPLGIINIDTGLREVFVAMVPEAYRQDIVRFANSEFQYICDALAVKLSSSVGPEKLN
jgi:hypothetical protein